MTPKMTQPATAVGCVDSTWHPQPVVAGAEGVAIACPTVSQYTVVTVASFFAPMCQ